jgi:hypothetical protein
MASLRERCAYHESAHVTAALVLGVPVISVSIDNDTPHMHRARYRAPHDCGLETIVTLCLAGPEAETLFCGQITDGSDQPDLRMAREYLARSISNPLRAAAELSRLRDAAQRLVRSAWAQQRIRLLADALLRHGTLTADDVAVLLDGSTALPLLGAVT